MISRKTTKKKTKSKKIIKRIRSNPEKVALDSLLDLLDMNSTDYHDDLSNNIFYDMEAGKLKKNPSKAELLKYLRQKKDILESLIIDFSRLE